MTYDVFWIPSVERELTQIWLASRMRHAITRDSDRIDRALHTKPSEFGESRESPFRVGFEGTLGVRFWIDDERQCVFVTEVWQTR